MRLSETEGGSLNRLELLKLALLFAAALPAALAGSASFAVVRRQSTPLALDFPFSTVYRNISNILCGSYRVRVRGNTGPFELSTISWPFDAANVSSQDAHFVKNLTTGQLFDDPTLAWMFWSADLSAGGSFACRVRDGKGAVLYGNEVAVRNGTSSVWECVETGVSTWDAMGAFCRFLIVALCIGGAGVLFYSLFYAFCPPFRRFVRARKQAAAAAQAEQDAAQAGQMQPGEAAPVVPVAPSPTVGTSAETYPRPVREREPQPPAYEMTGRAEKRG